MTCEELCFYASWGINLKGQCHELCITIILLSKLDFCVMGYSIFDVGSNFVEVLFEQWSEVNKKSGALFSLK